MTNHTNSDSVNERAAGFREPIVKTENDQRELIEKHHTLPKKDYSNKREQAATLCAIEGHPLQTLTRENEALSAYLTQTAEALRAGSIPADLPELIRVLSVHYAKKGDLLYPNLKVKYGISGPSDLMWTDDDEIRDALSALLKEETREEVWREKLARMLCRAEEMIYKENNILFPMCAVNFSQADWIGIYRDGRDYPDCLDGVAARWPEGETREELPAAVPFGEIVMPGGHMTIEQLTALLNTIPMEITFVDADNINRFFNEGPKVFKRPGMAIDREVFSCHPPKIEGMVRAIIEDFRAGRRNKVPMWMNKNGRSMLVTYMAVRNRAGVYLGTVELVQDMEFAKEHFEMCVT